MCAGLDQVGFGELPVPEMTGRKPDTDGVTVTHPLPDRLGDADQEPAAILHRSAIGIGSLVHPWRQELLQQVAMAGDDLHAIEPGPLHPVRRIAIEIDDPVDIRERHRARHVEQAFIRQGRGGMGDRPRAVRVPDQQPPRMKQLPEDLRSPGMHRLRQSRETRNGGVRRQARRWRMDRRLVNMDDLGEDQIRPAVDPRFVVGDALVARGEIPGLAYAVAGKEGPVSQAHRPKRDRREETGIGRRHAYRAM